MCIILHVIMSGLSVDRVTDSRIVFGFAWVWSCFEGELLED